MIIEQSFIAKVVKKVFGDKYRLVVAIGLLVFTAFLILSKTSASGINGDSTISGLFKGIPIVIRTTNRDAGAIASLTWNSKEFVDDHDHGRQIQSALQEDNGGEGKNPTEAGSLLDSDGPTSTSVLDYLSAVGNVLVTHTRMAYWQTYNGLNLSPDYLRKRVEIGFAGIPNAIEYWSTFTLAEAHSPAYVEAVTGYLPPEFNTFYSYNPTTHALTNITSMPVPWTYYPAFGSSQFPVIVSTADGQYAEGIYSPDSASMTNNFSTYIYTGFSGLVSKWTSWYLKPNAVSADHSFKNYIVVGNLTDVKTGMNSLETYFHPTPTPTPTLVVTPFLERTVAVADNSLTNTIWSTYSPFVMHYPGWDRYRMYFGRNEQLSDGSGLNGSADRIYLSENFGDGRSNWTAPVLVLRPGGVGEGALIHDPSLTIVNEIWHLYYTGTDNFSPDSMGHWNNKIFHATSNDGVNFVKRGAINIIGLPSQTGSWGYGEPSIIYEGGKYRLYFYSDLNPNDGTVFAAEGSDGQNFNYQGKVTNLVVLNPDISKYNGKYVLVGNSGFTKFLYATSNTPYNFLDSPLRLFYAIGSTGSWDTYHIGTPNLLATEGKLYYAGTNDSSTGASALDNSQIGSSLISLDYSTVVLTPTPTPTPIVTPNFTLTPSPTTTPTVYSKLMRSVQTSRVYYITNGGYKRWIPSVKIFLSYGNRWPDVLDVDQSRLDSIKDNILIKFISGNKVYKLENGKKRWVSSVAVFNNNGFAWDQVAPINLTEFNYYPFGATIK